MSFESEIEKRKTFAIVSHPDAGKTTLTEKLLLFGHAIHVAEAVKSNKKTDLRKHDGTIFEHEPKPASCHDGKAAAGNTDFAAIFAGFACDHRKRIFGKSCAGNG